MREQNNNQRQIIAKIFSQKFQTLLNFPGNSSDWNVIALCYFLIGLIFKSVCHEDLG